MCIGGFGICWSNKWTKECSEQVSNDQLIMPEPANGYQPADWDDEYDKVETPLEQLLKKIINMETQKTNSEAKILRTIF